MTAGTGDWSTHQLAEFLAAASDAATPADAARVGVERAAEILEAEWAALVRGSHVMASVGFPFGTAPDDELIALAAGGEPRGEFDGCPVAVATVGLPDDDGAALVVIRADEQFATTEINLLRAMARSLGQTLRMLETLELERTLRARSEELAAERAQLVAGLTEREQLLQRLSRIQRAISHRMPLLETLDTITAGAAELLREPVVGLRLLDPDDPGHYVMASCTGLDAEMAARIHRGPVGEGAGGRAIAENRLIVIDDYEATPNVVRPLAEAHLRSAIAAPVHENGIVVGSLVVASYQSGRKFSLSEQEALLALAEHASLALSDARNHESMLEAQRAKDLFLAMVSHELKTPLTVIMGSLRTMQHHGDQLPEDLRHELIGTAHDRGRQLEGLIDRLLRGARAELAGMRQDVSLPLLVSSAVIGFTQLRRVRVEPVPDAQVHVDAAAFRDVVGILLENALKHSADESEIVVGTRVVDDEIAITVLNGGSLPAGTDPASLFVPFQRGSGARGSGVGLGLYIAARLSESMGGHIDVDSTDCAVWFTLRIPAGSGSLAEFDALAGDPRDGSSGSGPSISISA